MTNPQLCPKGNEYLEDWCNYGFREGYELEAGATRRAYSQHVINCPVCVKYVEWVATPLVYRGQLVEGELR